jgi:hypothetical protein
MDAHALLGIRDRGFRREILRHAGLKVAALAAIIGAGASSVSSRAARARVTISPSFNWIA